ncbi:MAG TPA: thiamine pyrophosphate-binding protein [Candidatus Binatia bacterium]|nr:thiamine pyrophosphate-binding protein [Candidatus Binatia bacterium]
MSGRIAELADALVTEGVRAIFGIPGSGLSLDLIAALERRDVPFYATCHEGAAAIMAGAFGRRTRTLGCSISIKGPGLANMLGGVLVNRYEQRPTLSVAEAFGTATPLSRQHKRLDHALAVAPYTKAYAALGDPGATMSALATTARAEIPGPVHLDLDADAAPSSPPPVAGSPPPGEGAWAELERRVTRSERPAVIAGSLATRRPWGARLAALRIPVFTTFAAKGVIDETLRFAAGVFTGDGQALSPEARVLAEADLVVGLGLRNLEVLNARPLPCPVAIFDVVGGPTGDGFEPIARGPARDDADFGRLLDTLGGKAWGEDVVTDATRRVRARLTDNEWLPGALYLALEQALPDVGCFVVDTGYFCTVAEHVWRARSAEAFVASANGRSMGAGWPSAIGVALADRSRPTVCAVGDGGIATYFADLKLAIAERLPVLFLLLSDGRFGSVGGPAAARGVSSRATTVARPSWFKAVEMLGCPAEPVGDVGAFVTALKRWDCAGPLFIEAVFDAALYAGMIDGVR